MTEPKGGGEGTPPRGGGDHRCPAPIYTQENF
nr:MAG TPA_asm: hypothetical protein [Caudoviricetes sp.]